MLTLNIESSGYSPECELTYKLKKLSLECSSANASIFGYQNYNITTEEEDIDEEDDDDEEEDDDENENNDYISKAKSSIKNRASNFMSNHPKTSMGLNTAKNLAVKAKDFTQSSFSQLNNMPDKIVKSRMNKIVNNIAGNPKSIIGYIKSFVTSKTAKRAGLAALSMACLPAGIVALIANKKLGKSDKKVLIKQMEDELIRIDAKLDDASSADEKADLLIAKKQITEAAMKLKFNIKLR